MKNTHPLLRQYNSYPDYLLEEADQALAWGYPDKESTGYTHNELLDIIRRLADYIRLSTKAP